ncbi:polysaccharide biosynthesis protein [Microvirga makkahensis]|uniref:Polysaccharide biosynthesis protein n=1 Tax=Microvirga makkahensis TaxID=1128670 RepID=A0A7X3MTD6_9HYPH|nr:polysaccharide biosynthesis protein [Microvirga makkahensis]MXQ12897.1 polysaccharide biosynthesis protein [Microvirga makkahensis]
MTVPPIHTIATGREGSLFDTDIAAVEERLRDGIKGSRILVVGGAGSIGASTVLQLAKRKPAALHVVDHNENGLAELVRQLRSRPFDWSADDFRTLPLDYGSAAMRHFIGSERPYDLVLNFAALKHVRSEKDPYSTLQMFETNLIKQAKLMTWIGEAGFKGRLFTVSTDKAANPSSMMGATKRVMEHVLFNSSVSHALKGPKVSARFANVAFSNGSLLQGFENRFARREPIAAPMDTRRYFVSLTESGQICAIASVIVPGQSIVVPKLDPEEHLVALDRIAERFIRYHGLEPAIYEDEQSACASVESELKQGRWPLLLTPRDTAGEKPYEEFMTESETSFDLGMPNLEAVSYVAADRQAIDRVLTATSELLNADFGAQPLLTKERLKEIIASVEPSFLETHRDAKANLDQRL